MGVSKAQDAAAAAAASDVDVYLPYGDIKRVPLNGAACTLYCNAGPRVNFIATRVAIMIDEMRDWVYWIERKNRRRCRMAGHRSLI